MQIGRVTVALRRVGVLGTLKLLASRRRLQRVLPRWTTVLRLQGYEHPFHFRHGSTDRFVIDDVLLGGQYDFLRGLTGIRTIVDAGANIGTASITFLNAYPAAAVYALEPDPGNFRMLVQNIGYYAPRAIPLRLALWNRPEQLAIYRGGFRDGGEWSYQVRPSDCATTDVEGVTISDLMLRYGLEAIDLLKVDVEGAERHIFEAPDLSWIDRVGLIAVELHNEECREAFHRAVNPRGGRIERFGEVTVWRR